MTVLRLARCLWGRLRCALSAGHITASEWDYETRRPIRTWCLRCGKEWRR